MRLFILTLLVFFGLESKEHAIVYIESSSEHTNCVNNSIRQAKYFNHNTPVYFIGSKSKYKKNVDFFIDNDVYFVDIQTLKKGKLYQDLKKNFLGPIENTLSNVTLDELKFSLLDFAIFYEFLRQFPLRNVFYMNHKNMIYISLEEVLDQFFKSDKVYLANYNSSCASKNFFFVKDVSVLDKIVSEFYEKDLRSLEAVLGRCGLKKSGYVEHLSVIPKEYLALIKAAGKDEDFGTTNPYRGAVDYKNVLFDPGIHSVFCSAVKYPVAYERASCLVAEEFNYTWEDDHEGRRIPYLIYGQKKYKLANLNFNCESVEPFLSK
jgi:hypothetical protein